MDLLLKIEKAQEKVKRIETAIRVENGKKAKARHFLPDRFVQKPSTSDTIFRPLECVVVADVDTCALLDQAFLERKYSSIFQAIGASLDVDRHDVCIIHERNIIRNGKKANVTYFRYVFNIEANDFLKASGKAKFDVLLKAWNAPIKNDLEVKAFAEGQIKDYFSIVIDIDAGIVWRTKESPKYGRKIELSFVKLPQKVKFNFVKIINLISNLRSMDEIKYDTIVFHNGQTFVNITDHIMVTECPYILVRYAVSRGTPRYILYSVVSESIDQIVFGDDSSRILAQYMDTCRVLNISGFETNVHGERNTGVLDGVARISNSQYMDRSQALSKLKSTISFSNDWDEFVTIFYSIYVSLGLFTKAESIVRFFVFKQHCAGMCFVNIIAAREISDIKKAFDGEYAEQIESSEYRELRCYEKLRFVDLTDEEITCNPVELIKEHVYCDDAPSTVFSEPSLNGCFEILSNEIIDDPKCVMSKALNDGIFDLYLYPIRPEIYALLISLGFYDLAKSVCKFYYFEDTRHAIAALNVDEILKDNGLIEFHERVQCGKYRELEWDERIHGHNINNNTCILNSMDLIPSGYLPEIVLFESKKEKALITDFDHFFEVNRLCLMLTKDKCINYSESLMNTFKCKPGELFIQGKTQINNFLSSGLGSPSTIEQAKYVGMKLDEVLSYYE